jgi:uncharacterized protein (DUF1778 family)
MRDAHINLIVSSEQRDLIDRAAALLGKNRSDFILEVACERVRAILQNQIYFDLSSDKLLEFNAILDAHPLSNPGLERLMKVQTSWKT